LWIKRVENVMEESKAVVSDGGLYFMGMPELGGREDERVMNIHRNPDPSFFGRLRPSDLVSIPRLGRYRRTV